ncbi:MAG: SUMF1/EgtB/PvdO family nonheme iron enzyme [Magnetococcales bacterium]|nr:SUMF1/EgtB/PvdO family nonheme iron enzyme [Magnetococcales bacterium]
MQQLPPAIPIVLVDIENFSQWNQDEQAKIIDRLQTGLRESLKPLIGYANPDTIINRHGAGDGYYLFLQSFSTPVAMRVALNLENFLLQDNQKHPRYPLRLRVVLTLGSVGLKGDQYLGEALTEAARLIDHDWIRKILKTRKESPVVLATSNFFWDDWHPHPQRTAPELTFPEERPWIAVELSVKHGRLIGAHVQVEPTTFFPIAQQQTIQEKPVETSACDLTPWLKSLHDETRYLTISGIGSGGGRGKTANLYPIEDLYTVIKCHDIVINARQSTMERMGGQETRGKKVNLAELLPRHKRLLIEGQPGSGKTTFLKLTAAMLARDILGNEPCPGGGTWRKRHLGLDDRLESPIPLFLRLSELARLLSDRPPPKMADDRFRLLDLLQTTRDAGREATWRDYWQTLLEEGRVLLLLDGLDEVADDRLRERVFAIFQSAVTHWKKNTIIVSSRPIEAERLEQMGFQRTVIEPFGIAQTQEFIDHWSAALYGQAIGVPGGAAEQHAEILVQAILAKHSIRKLAANPVMLTCLCVVHWNEGQLPEGRARVYRAVIRWLLGAKDEVRADFNRNEQERYTTRFAHESFAAIALAMMGGRQGRKKAIFDLEEAAKAVMPLHERHFPDVTTDRLVSIRKWIQFECIYSGILEEMGRNRLRFWHLTFQEYLAAQNLAWMSDDKESGWWPLVEGRLEDPHWRETIDLFPGVLFDEGGSQRPDELLTRVVAKWRTSTWSDPFLKLVPGKRHNNGLAEAAHKAGLLVRILEPMKVYQYQPSPEIQKEYRQVRNQALNLFTLEGAAKVPIKVRLAAAEALGQGGDPRLTEDKWRENLIKVPGTDICLGKYPVTVQEYQRFVEDGGYDNPDYWQEDHAWTFRQAHDWKEPDQWAQQLDHGNRPVVRVSWYEARAYCLWLTRQKSDVTRDIRFFLPNEDDWERAATPTHGDYPWGTENPTPELANYSDGKIGAPTPVGLYPAGNSSLGHCDLAGNVWEWCSTPGSKKDAIEEDAVKYGPPKVVRGGSWGFPASDLQVGGRGGRIDGRAGYRGAGLGFRLAAPASTLDP